MDVSAVTQSVEAVNQLMQTISTEQIESVQKMVRVNTQMALASQPGLGEVIDMVA